MLYYSGVLCLCAGSDLIMWMMKNLDVEEQGKFMVQYQVQWLRWEVYTKF
jgi:hypothetical protein